MVIVSAFKDGSTALRANPALLVAGLLVALTTQLQNVGEFTDSPAISAAGSLAWLVIFPFVLGGFIGMARNALRDSDASFGAFLAAGRRYYVRVLFATVLFLLIVLVAAIGLGIVSFVTGVGVLALGVLNETAGMAAAVGVTLVWLALLLVVIMFLQFYDTAIVVENEGTTDSLRRSVALVRANLRSVVGFSLLWVVLFNLFLVPEYLVRITVTDADAPAVLTVDPNVSLAVLIPVSVVLSTVGFAYIYTVYTAYYVRLVAREPAASPSL